MRSRIIIGAGIAGLSMADALLKKGVDPSTVTVIDACDSRRGSSSPVTMIHPFPGRTMDLRRGHGEAFERSWRILRGWGELPAERSWWQRAPMIRPLTKGWRGDLLRESWDEARESYPLSIVVEELSAQEISDRFDGVEISTTALVYEPAASVLLPVLLRALRADLERRGVAFINGKMVALRGGDASWEVILADGASWQGQEVILAVGAALRRFFPALDLRSKAGEVVILDPGESKLSALVNGEKHIFERPDGLWGLGSTYFRAARWSERDDEAAIAELVAGVSDVVPAVQEARVVRVWRGERGVFGSDSMPLVGAVPAHPGLFCFAAFGSKGMLLAPAAARDLAAHLEGDDEAISPFMDCRRLRAEKFAFPQAGSSPQAGGRESEIEV